MDNEMVERVAIHYPIDEDGRVEAARLIEQAARIAVAGGYQVDLDAFVFLVPGAALTPPGETK